MPGELTPFAIIGAFVIGLSTVVIAGLQALRTGKLITANMLEKLETALREQVDAAERREETAWVAYRASEERAKVRDEQARQSLEMMRTMTNVWDAVRQLLERGQAPP